MSLYIKIKRTEELRVSDSVLLVGREPDAIGANLSSTRARFFYVTLQKLFACARTKVRLTVDKTRDDSGCIRKQGGLNLSKSLFVFVWLLRGPFRYLQSSLLKATLTCNNVAFADCALSQFRRSQVS